MFPVTQLCDPAQSIEYTDFYLIKYISIFENNFFEI